MKESGKGALLLVIAFLIFGSFGIAAKYIQASPLMLLYGMQAAGLIVLFVILMKEKNFSTKGMLKGIAIMTFFALVTDFSFFAAVKLMNVSNVVFIRFTAPVLILIFAPFIIKEKVERKSLLAIPIALLGLFLILYQGKLVFDSDATGIIYSLITAVSLALFIIFVKQVSQKVKVNVLLFYRYLIGVIVLTPLVMLEQPSVSYELIAVLMVFGVIFGYVASVIHQEGVKKSKTQTSGILMYIEPLSAAVYGIFVLSEIPTIFTIAGAALIIASTYFALKN
ncbi:MAG TPA: DMT family transporter [archaeon]|nr:DMT family transporter [archaeon]